MTRLIGLLLLLTSLTFGSAVAAQDASEDDIEAALQQLVADSDAQAAWPNRVAEFLATQEDLSIFLMLLEQAQLTESLAQAEGPITIFAPTDAAFAGMDQQEFEALFHDAGSLRELLERHIAAGTYATSDSQVSVAGGGQVQEESAAAAPGGPNVSVAVERDLTIDGLTLHVIDRVLLPGDSADASER